jgi:hypothetical protein
MSNLFTVIVDPPIAYFKPGNPPSIVFRECRIPRIDCFRRPAPQDNNVDAVVTYRYSEAGYDWNSIDEGWDIRVVHMLFAYNSSQHEWSLVNQNDISSDAMADDTETPSGQTHPDIVYDLSQRNNNNNVDIYCAWTNISSAYGSHLYYQRYNHTDSEWKGPYELKYPDRSHDPWYVSLDTGIVKGADPASSTTLHRIVGFAYTGDFPELQEEDPPLWGYRPVLGGWYIDNGPDDANHRAGAVIITPGYIPELNGAKYYAGMARICIPSDNASEHGAGLVYIQDTEDDGPGTYHIFGLSSLDWGDDDDFVALDVPFNSNFDYATLPSLAIHQDYGDKASVSFFGRDPSLYQWKMYATSWDMANKDVSVATQVDQYAEGQFVISISDFIYHDYGTCSSLAIIDEEQTNKFWAAWSDKTGPNDDPRIIYGSMGFPTQ